MSLYKLLKNAGIHRAEVRYQGGGDSGGIEEIHAWDKEGKEVVTGAELDSALSNYVYDGLQGGWEINEGSQGTVVFDMETREVEFQHVWNGYDTNTREYTYQGDD
jgi:hypothetical protein